MARPLRVMVVDSEYRYSVGGSLCRGFHALGHKATFFDQSRFLGGWSRQTPLRRLALAAIRPATTTALNFALLTAVFARRPDLVVVLKGYFILPETIDAMRRAARFVVSYQPDDLENPLNTSESMRRSLPTWDVLFSPRSFTRDELLARGVRRWELLPFGYDPVLSHPAPAGVPPEPVGHAAVFVGTWAPERAEMLERLAPQVALRVWGSDWDRVPASSPLVSALRRRQVLGEDLCAVFTHAGVNLAFLRKGNRDLHQMRTFEVPACGGLLLTERTPDHQALFDEGKEALYFGSPDELEALATRYLADPAAARAIAAAGHRRLLAGGHRYQDRAARIVAVVSEMD